MSKVSEDTSSVTEPDEHDQHEYEQHREVGRELQEACDTVLAADLGTDHDAIEERLRHELQARGHWPQPKLWVEAVIEEIQIGHHYRVTGFGAQES